MVRDVGCHACANRLQQPLKNEQPLFLPHLPLHPSSSIFLCLWHRVSIVLCFTGVVCGAFYCSLFWGCRPDSGCRHCLTRLRGPFLFLSFSLWLKAFHSYGIPRSHFFKLMSSFYALPCSTSLSIFLFTGCIFLMCLSSFTLHTTLDAVIEPADMDRVVNDNGFETGVLMVWSLIYLSTIVCESKNMWRGGCNERELFCLQMMGRERERKGTFPETKRFLFLIIFSFLPYRCGNISFHVQDYLTTKGFTPNDMFRQCIDRINAGEFTCGKPGTWGKFGRSEK